MGMAFYTVGVGMFIMGACSMDSADMRLPAALVVCGIVLAGIGYWMEGRWSR